MAGSHVNIKILQEEQANIKPVFIHCHLKH